MHHTLPYDTRTTPTPRPGDAAEAPPPALLAGEDDHDPAEAHICRGID
ncbi:surface protein [Streptomyces sp. NPDC052101]